MGLHHLPQAHELHLIIHALEAELQKLDRIGAGLAAVHVNAAIEQLRTNLDVVNDNCRIELGELASCLKLKSAEKV